MKPHNVYNNIGTALAIIVVLAALVSAIKAAIFIAIAAVIMFMGKMLDLLSDIMVNTTRVPEDAPNPNNKP